MKHNLNYEDVVQNWRYCGGNSGRHRNYYNLLFPKEPLPTLVDKCVCGHNIIENCYITNDIQKLVLGNCCIKRFVPKCTRTCSVCGDVHRNTSINKCNTCRNIKTYSGFCIMCKKETNPQYEKCFRCSLPPHVGDGKCFTCAKSIDKKYIQCYKCKMDDVRGGDSLPLNLHKSG